MKPSTIDKLWNEPHIRVRFFQRRPRPGSNFSMESIFEDVRRRLSNRINADVQICSRFNDGWGSKVVNIIEAAWRQSNSINHVTGEVHFLTLLMRSRRTVLTVLDCGFMERKQGIARLIVKWIYLDLPIRRCKIVTAISQKTKDEIIGYTRCSPDKVRVVLVAIDDEFKPWPKPFNVVKPTILQIGTGYNKNILRLAEALRDIECTLVIVGKLSADQIDVLRTNKIDYQNRFNLTKVEMIDEYKRCDVVSFVSTFEGFGMPIVEANAIERVVVTSSVSSMPEVAGSAACLVDPFDVDSIQKGLQRVINDSKYRETLIENGRANRYRFDGDRIANEYFDVYESVLNGST